MEDSVAEDTILALINNHNEANGAWPTQDKERYLSFISQMGVSPLDVDMRDAPQRSAKDQILLDRQLRAVDRYTQLAKEMGLKPELLEPRENAFQKFLNIIDKPKQAVLGVLDAGLIRGDLGQVGVVGAASRGLDERANWFDILRREGVENTYLRGALGFAGEVLTDPLTYLTLGSAAVKSLPKAGGRAITETGVALRDKLIQAEFLDKGAMNSIETLPSVVKQAGVPAERELSKILPAEVGKANLIEVNESVEQFFRSLGAYSDAAKAMERTPNPWKKTILKAELDKQFQEIAPTLARFGVDQDTIKNMFVGNQIRFGMQVPFLGYFRGKDASVALDASASKLKKFAVKAGEVLNPDDVTFIKTDFPDKAGAMLEQFKYSTGKWLTTLSKGETPVISSAARGVKKVDHAVDSFLDGAKNIFLQTFHPAGAMPKNAALARTDLQMAKRAADLNARFLTTALYEGIKDNEAARRGVGLIVDRAASSVVDDVLKNDDMRAAFYAGVDALVKSKAEVSPENIADLVANVKNNLGKALGTNADEAIDSFFLDKLALQKQTFIGDPKALEYVDRTIAAFNDIRRMEKEAGVGSSMLDFYIPHIVTTLRDKGGKGFQATGAFFNQQRKYRTFQELLQAGGHLAETDIATIFYKRFLRSQELIAEKRYLERALFESHVDPKVLQSVYRAAISGDEAAYDALRVKGFNLPKALDENSLKNLRFQNQPEDFFSEAGNILTGLDSKAKVPLQDQVRVIEALQGVQNETRAKAFAMGLKPDAWVPLTTFGEPGVYKQFGNKEMYLPPTVARAIDDILEKRGPVEKFVQGSPIAEKLLKMSDTFVGWMKKSVTLPWPAYWSQNVIGDGVRRMLDQAIGVVNPGTYAELSAVLNGEAALKVPWGVISPQQFQEILKTYGVRMSYKDYLGILDDMGRVNMDFLEKQARTIPQNIKKLELATAAGKATERLQDVFEDFMRMHQLVHELKKGSTISSAVQSMNKVMFDYRDLSRWESSLFRRFYMFYPWLKKSTAYTLNQMFLQPGALSNQIRTARGIAEVFSDPNALPTFEERDSELLKDVVQRNQISFPVGRDKKGSIVTGRGFGLPLSTPLSSFTIEMPRNMDWSEWLDAANASFVRTLQQQFASANPWANSIAQKISGKNLYFDKPLDSAFINTVPKLAKIAEGLPGYSFTHIPAEALDSISIKYLDAVDNGKGGYRVNPTKFFLLVNFIPGFSRMIATANRFSNEDLTTQHKLLHFFTGIRVDPTDAQRTRVAEVASNLRQQLEAVGAFVKNKA